MTTETFQRNFVQVVKAAKLCLDQDLEMPALILIYSLIDTFAWAVAGQSEKNTRTRFESWLKRQQPEFVGVHLNELLDAEVLGNLTRRSPLPRVTRSFTRTSPRLHHFTSPK